MGLMGRYIDSLPPAGRDRLITAQEWCVAGVLGRGGGRCLVGHAEDWGELAVDPAAWRSWMDGETAGRRDADLACRTELFAFRRARPGDLEVYRARVARWGLASEGRIGARFDRLCGRRGIGAAVGMVKRRAGLEFSVGTLLEAAQPASPSSSSEARRIRTRSSSRSSGTP
jgi:hypothetical protein